MAQPAPSASPVGSAGTSVPAAHRYLSLGFGLTVNQVKNSRNKSAVLNRHMQAEVARLLLENRRLLHPREQRDEVEHDASSSCQEGGADGDGGGINGDTGGERGESGRVRFTKRAISSRSDIAVVLRSQFREIIKIVLVAYEYTRASRVEDFDIASLIQERKKPLVILFGGTSGCGKSTLASLMASRLGITKVLSTDSVRHMMRSFQDPKDNPVLFASTYHAGECLDASRYGHLSTQERVLEGYRQQCRGVIDQLDKIITSCEQRNEPLVVEGVHLLTDFMVELLRKHPQSVIPFVVHISNKDKHKERFAIRAKYMTLEPRNNKYIKYFENISSISNFLCERADLFKIPRVDNTNIDRSLATIHLSIFKCLRKLHRGEMLFDPMRGTVTMPDLPVVWSSSRVLSVIRRKRESLELRIESGQASLPAFLASAEDAQNVAAAELSPVSKPDAPHAGATSMPPLSLSAAGASTDVVDGQAAPARPSAGPSEVEPRQAATHWHVVADAAAASPLPFAVHGAGPEAPRRKMSTQVPPDSHVSVVVAGPASGHVEVAGAGAVHTSSSSSGDDDDNGSVGRPQQTTILEEPSITISNGPNGGVSMPLHPREHAGDLPAALGRHRHLRRKKKRVLNQWDSQGEESLRRLIAQYGRDAVNMESLGGFASLSDTTTTDADTGQDETGADTGAETDRP